MADAFADARRGVRRRVAELRSRFAAEGAAALGAAALELAAAGPGFFMFHKHASGAADEEEDWAQAVRRPRWRLAAGRAQPAR